MTPVAGGAEERRGKIIPKMLKSTPIVLSVRQRPESVNALSAWSSLTVFNSGMSVAFSTSKQHSDKSWVAQDLAVLTRNTVLEIDFELLERPPYLRVLAERANRLKLLCCAGGDPE